MLMMAESKKFGCSWDQVADGDLEEFSIPGKLFTDKCWSLQLEKRTFSHYVFPLLVEVRVLISALQALWANLPWSPAVKSSGKTSNVINCLLPLCPLLLLPLRSSPLPSSPFCPLPSSSSCSPLRARKWWVTRPFFFFEIVNLLRAKLVLDFTCISQYLEQEIPGWFCWLMSKTLGLTFGYYCLATSSSTP